MSLISLLCNLFYCIKNSLNSGHFFHSCRLWWSFNSRKSQLVNRLEFHVPTDWGDFKQNGILPRDSHFTIEKPSKDKRENVFVYGVNSENQRFSLEIIWNPVHDNQNGYISAKFFLQDGETCYHYTAAERIFNSENEIYRVGDLTLEVKLPFSLLILRLKGICKFTQENAAHGHKFLDVTMLIKPPYEVFDHGLIHEPSFLTSQLCQQSVFDENPSLPDTYDVGVQIRSNISIDHGPEREIHLFGHRGKLYQEISDELSCSIEVTRFFGYSPKKGYHFSLSNTRDEKRGTEIINGCASWGINWAYPVQETTFNQSLLNQHEFEFTMKTQFREYFIKIFQKEVKNLRFRSISIDQSPGWSYTLMHPFELPSSNEFLQFDYFDRILPKVDRLVVSIDDHDCLNSSMTGGKGSSLAKLNLMKDVIAEKDGEKCCFAVPKAIVITNAAQKRFLDATNSLDEINTLQKEAGRNETERICSDLVKHIEMQELTEHLKSVIRIKMDEYFGDSWGTRKFAVRSSAVGEDSETMSCAGQMETFLGVQGEDDIFKSIIKCWASQYRFIAVQYKRNNGLPVANDMAVVIQELVECDKAGVLFTCDPVTGNLSQMVITANYGLGESVVSSISEPDTIRVNLEIDHRGNLSISGIHEIVIGSKEKIVTTAGDEPGSQIMENERRENCCIDEKEIMKLSEVCLKICRFYRGSCDIEWGIKSSSKESFKVYIFQCRPVTSANAPSDWQLIHELDSAHPCETECLTRANVGEVYPGASSHICLTLQLPLGSFGFIKRFLFAIKKFRLTPYNGRGIMICRNNVFFCIKDGALMRYDQEPGKESLTTLGMEYSLLGRRMDDLEVKKDSYERLTTGPKIPAWKGLINLFQMIAPVYWKVKRFENKPISIDLNDTQKNGTSHKLFLTLLRNFEHQWKAFDLHLCSTFASSFMNLFLIGLLSTEDDCHLFTDFSLLLSSCEKFVSARIPESLRELAELILPSKEKFLSLSDDQALQYFNESSNPVYLKYKKFMEENGHRGLKEYDWSGKVWRKNPAAILQPLRILLQTNCASHGVTSKNNDDEIIKQLKTPLSKKSKFLLKRIALPLARTFVGTREESKNKCVWSIDQQRKVFDRIAEMCVSENLLPDASLLCYMTSFEVFQLTSHHKSSSQLVSLAKRRKKLLSAIDEYEYPSLVYGPAVEPSSRGIEDISNIQIEFSDVIKGTVVSRGKTKGKVYVARKIEDIDGIQAGDILVTYSTDVGWSPFFPIIGGLITEIGGLISHGAVVAREFGLPCVVGVRGATQVLKTGETITLDADNGIIMKISND